MYAEEQDGFAEKVIKGLEQGLPKAFVIARPLQSGRLAIKLISTRLDGLDESEKQDVVWKALEDLLGKQIEQVAVVVAYGADEF